jgi:hypothetical protein
MREVYANLDHIIVRMELVLKMDLNNRLLKMLLLIILEEKMNVNIEDMIHINELNQFLLLIKKIYVEYNQVQLNDERSFYYWI